MKKCLQFPISLRQLELKYVYFQSSNPISPLNLYQKAIFIWIFAQKYFYRGAISLIFLQENSNISTNCALEYSNLAWTPCTKKNAWNLKIHNLNISLHLPCNFLSNQCTQCTSTTLWENPMQNSQIFLCLPSYCNYFSFLTIPPLDSTFHLCICFAF